MPAPRGNKYAKGNKGGGRPRQYLDRYADLAYKHCLKGAIDSDLAVLFGVSEQSINNWKKEHKEFSLALERGKAKVDAKIAQALYKKAKAGDMRAIIFWLKNRQPQHWREKQEHQIAAPEPITIIYEPYEEPDKT